MSPAPNDPVARDPIPRELPPPPQHPGPDDGWRPLSGLCLAAFILALALSLLSLVSLWAGVLLPLLLGLLALVTVDGTRYRGRALAWWAVGLCLVFGSIGYLQTRTLQSQVTFLVNGVVTALRSERPEAERTAALEAWLAGAAPKTEARERIESRWKNALERLGPIQGPPILPSVLAGHFPIFAPPSGVVPVDSPQDLSALPAPGSVLWALLPFERGEVHLALVVGDGTPTGLAEPMTLLAEERAVPIVRDVRFYARSALLTPAPGAPTER